MSIDVAIVQTYPGIRIDVQFSVPGAGVTALFGPSGCGKSTVISAVAGLLRPEHCSIAVDGHVLTDTETQSWLPPERRRIGLVFQDPRLFPHLSVASNLRYGLRRAPAGQIRMDDVVDLLGLAALLHRRPRTLSGGEKQRVAIGRALLAQPHLLLMDEPLAALDGPRKAEILPFLARLNATLALPTLYVTHSIEEVVQLASSLVLLDAGRVVACGPLDELSARADLPLAARDDAAAVLECRVLSHDPARGLTLLNAGGLLILVPLVGQSPGAPMRVRIPAREVILAGPAVAAVAGSLSLHNVLSGRVRAIAPAGLSALVEVAFSGGNALLSRVTPDAVQRLGLVTGVPVLALVKSVAIEVVDPGPGFQPAAPMRISRS